MWIRSYGVPCHAWCSVFFIKVANSQGSFICLDENITNKTCMDIARFMVRVSDSFILPDVLSVEIDGMDYLMVLREDSFGPVKIVNTRKPSEDSNINISDSSSSEDSWSFIGNEEEGEKETNGVEALPVGFSLGDSGNKYNSVTQKVLEKHAILLKTSRKK